jgi:cell division protein FtsB
MITVTVLTALMLIFVPEYQRYRRNLEIHEKTQAEVKRDQEIIQRLKDDQKRFKTDASFVQKIAHEHGMVRPGEILFRFPDDEDSGQY